MSLISRFFDPLTIHYIVYVPHPPEMGGNPWETTGIERISHILYFLPYNYVQLFHSFEYSSKVFCSMNIDFKLSFVHSYESFIEIMDMRWSKINVLIMVAQDDNMVKKATEYHEKIFFIYNKNIGIALDTSYTFDCPYELSQKLLSKRDDIILWFSSNISKDIPIGEILDAQFLDDNLDFYDFKPSLSLTSYINRYLGKMWQKRIEQTRVFDHSKRSEILLDLLKQCDRVSLIGTYHLKQKNIPAHPIFICSPFFDSPYRKVFEGADNDLCTFLGTEQNFDYEHLVSSKIQKKITQAPAVNAMAHAIKGFKVLDIEVGAYLHASLSFSPLIRLPEKGKTFSSILAIYKNGKSPDARKNYKKMQEFGKLLSDNLFFSGLKEYLLEFERQIVFVSDLPIEWASINEVPIGFLFDICRLPSNATRLLNSFSYNNFASYAIDENTFKKHLVISSDDSDIKKYSADNFAEILDIKINHTHCSSLAEVSSAIQKSKPHLLFIDCHGGFDEKNSLSYLCFGNEKITYKEIISENISAPLVVLSCCNSSPLASLNAVGDAFLGAGAFAVLATTHPIGLASGSIIVSRILKNLQYAVTHNVHNNWLNFISHVLRTSIHHQYLTEITRRTGIQENSMNCNVIDDNLTDPRVLWRSQTMMFSERMQCYKNLGGSVLECFPLDKRNEVKAAVENIPPPWEYLYYSHLGRPDLVFFQNYLNEHKFVMPVNI